MPYTQFPSRHYVRELNTSETMIMGGWTVAAPFAMTKAVLTIYKHGTGGGSEALRLKVFGSETTSATPIATSSYSALADIPSLGTYWIGNLRFDFPTPVNLSPASAAYIALEATNYTRSMSFYISYVLDWPYPVSTQLTDGSASGAIRIIGYQL